MLTCTFLALQAFAYLAGNRSIEKHKDKDKHKVFLFIFKLVFCIKKAPRGHLDKSIEVIRRKIYMLAKKTKILKSVEGQI